ncbi:MAG: TatD family hydrolase [Kiritimatiellae bacterium]|nr:TatD family hydrolase [Kiritimatiellia bacterium]
MRWFDAHAHVSDPRLSADANGLALRARNAGVGAIACHGSRPEDWPEVRRISSSAPLFHAGYGLHPWFVPATEQVTPDWRDRLAGFLQVDPNAAVGEIGLDYAPEYRNDPAQHRALLDQWRLSIDLRRPVVLHVRRAWEPMLHFLREHGPHPVGMVLHAYNGGRELIPTLLPYNAFFSFGGSVTFEQHHRPRNTVVAVPLERLLLETDAPDIAIAGCPPDRPPEPADLPQIGRAVAELRSTSLEDLAAATWRNTAAVYGVGS